MKTFLSSLALLIITATTAAATHPNLIGTQPTPFKEPNYRAVERAYRAPTAFEAEWQARAQGGLFCVRYPGQGNCVGGGSAGG